MNNNLASIEPSELDATITALGKVWNQAFRDLRNPNLTEDEFSANAIAAATLMRQALRLNKEQTISVIAREQLRHLNVEDEYHGSVVEVSKLFSDLKDDLQQRFDYIDRTLQPMAAWMQTIQTQMNAIVELVNMHSTQIYQIKNDVAVLMKKINENE